MLQASEQLQNSTLRLEQARRQALETEQIGLDVMADLRQQRETINSSRAGVSTIGSNVGVAKAYIDSITRRAKANKVITYVVLAFLLLVGVGTWWLVRGGGGPSGSGARLLGAP